MKAFHLVLVILFALFLAGAISCDSEEDEDEDSEDYGLTSARDSCKKLRECFPEEYEFEFNGLDECEDYLEGVSEGGGWFDVYCYEYCKTDGSCAKWDGCLASCSS